MLVDYSSSTPDLDPDQDPDLDLDQDLDLDLDPDQDLDHFCFRPLIILSSYVMRAQPGFEPGRFSSAPKPESHGLSPLIVGVYQFRHCAHSFTYFAPYSL